MKKKRTSRKKPGKAKPRALLATMTNEPFQPVRLYSAIPGRPYVNQRLRGLKCMASLPGERKWEWLFHGEAASLRIGDGGYDEVPEERRPIILGRIHFAKRGGMTLETNSIPRAIEGARFFGPRLGPEVVATRCRVVNRCFAADEGKLPDLMKTLDRDVTVVDPREAEEDFMREHEGVRTMEDAERAAARIVEQRLESGKDVPMVEDFPLAPEEETPDFHHLETTLKPRGMRAIEHWKGNRELTLTALILRMAEQSAGRRVGG